MEEIKGSNKNNKDGYSENIASTISIKSTVVAHFTAGEYKKGCNCVKGQL